jgi:hypothetical protein
VDMHATDLVGINGITRVLLVHTCQQGVCPRGFVLPVLLPVLSVHFNIIIGPTPICFGLTSSIQNDIYSLNNTPSTVNRCLVTFWNMYLF